MEKEMHTKLNTVSGSSYIHLTSKVLNHVQIHAHVGVRSVKKAHKLHQNVWCTYHRKRLQSANHLTQGSVNARRLANVHYINMCFVWNLHMFLFFWLVQSLPVREYQHSLHLQFGRQVPRRAWPSLLWLDSGPAVVSTCEFSSSGSSPIALCQSSWGPGDEEPWPKLKIHSRTQELN